MSATMIKGRHEPVQTAMEETAMGKDPQAELRDFKKEKDFFIAIDSDGCAFDTMEIKHKECFCPEAIRCWNLQVVSKYAREAWDFVNLYSTTRGCNRFIGLLKVIELLGNRKEVQARNAVLPDMRVLLEWTKKESKLGNPALAGYARKVRHPVLDTALEWSLAVNEAIEKMVHDIPPFPFVRESLAAMADKADIMVASQASTDSLIREWRDLAGFVRVLAGQEAGTKTEHLHLAARGKYPAEKILMIGDANGDLAAARTNNALFFPIIPGKEEESWERFFKEGMARFFAGTFAGSYAQALKDEFAAYLPENPPWEKR
jgi:phosphoglycolate phosphatase-like HAD superfamily hydrolase